MRAIVDPHLSGAENMRHDEALLAEGRAALRLYGWRPAAVSLGRSQTRDVVDLDAAAEYGVDVVERATGGGAILHNEREVTYAVVLPLNYPGLPRDVPGSFAFVSQGIVNALSNLGVQAAIEGAPSKADEALCYLRHQGTNVFVNGRKISGGAQRRTATSLLQHGTVVVERDEVRMARLLRADVDEVRRKVTSLEQEGVRVSREKLVEALLLGFEQALSTHSGQKNPRSPERRED